MITKKVTKNNSQARGFGRFLMRFAEPPSINRRKMRSFDLHVGNSFNGRESADEICEYGMICTEADGPTKRGNLAVVCAVETYGIMVAKREERDRK
jgi:hypothetical protein